MKFKQIWNKIIEFSKRNEEEKEDEEEFEKFLKKVEGRMNKIPSAQKALTSEGKAQIALMFENAYTQRKITEANQSLKSATWILAIATIAFTVGTIYGEVELNNTIRIVLQIILGFIIIALSFKILEFIWKLIKLIIKFFQSRKFLK